MSATRLRDMNTKLIRRITRQVLAVIVCTMLTMLPATAEAAGAGSSKYTRLINNYQNSTLDAVVSEASRREKLGSGDDALVLYMIAASRSSATLPEHGKQLIAKAFMKMGDIYYSRNDYANALEAYADGLHVCESSSRHYWMALFLNNIGKLYCIFSDYEKGEEYFNRGYLVCRRYRDAAAERKLTINLTGLNLKLGRTGKARYFQRKAVKMKRKGDFDTNFMIDFNGAMITAAEGKTEKAVRMFARLAEAATGSGERARYKCSAYQEIYNIYLNKGKCDSARKYLDRCWEEARRRHIEHQFVEVLNDYSLLYRSMGNVARSQQYKSRYLMMSDTIFNSRRIDTARNALSRYEMLKANREIAQLQYDRRVREHTISSQRGMLWVTSVATLLILVFLIVLWRQNRRLHQSYSDLFKINRKAIDEQETMRRQHSSDMKLIETLEKRIVRSGDAVKYSTSNLNESSRDAIAQGIEMVMDNTEEICSTGFSLDRLAELVGSNSKYVSQVINEKFNRNFSSCVNDRRIRLACKRLVDPAYKRFTIKAISQSVGYGSHAAFINAFRKSTGLTPSQYQKMAEQKPEAD